jgi:hypothetical protein
MFAHSLFALFLLAFAVVIFVPALIIGSVGGHRLVTTRQQRRLYTGTTCLLLNVTDEILSIDCTCDGCHPSTCYAEHFSVQYSIENGSYLSGVIDIDQIPYRLQVQVHSTCSLG